MDAGQRQQIEAAVLEEPIVIEDNPVMRMCLTSVIHETNRSGHRMFNKDKATSRIDGAVSLAMSIGMATLAATEKPKTYTIFFV